MKQVVLRHALSAAPVASDFAVVDAPAPSAPDGGVVVETLHLSLDPYVGARLRGRHMGDPAPTPGVEPIPGAIVGRVVESKAADVAVGDLVHSMAGSWAERVAIPGDALRRLDPEMAPPRAHLSTLGMPGLTAWAGVTQLAKIRPGDVLLVDAAAGAVGGCAGQIAKLRGAAAVGIAGGAEKTALVRDCYGFDACVDYQAPDWERALDAALPAAPTVLFENVSIAMLTAGLMRAAPYVRVVLCGLAARYQADGPQAEIPAGLVIGKRAALFGLVVYDFYDRWDAFLAEAAPWVRSGQLKVAEDRAQGLDAAPALFERLMRGANVGKCIVDVGAA